MIAESKMTTVAGVDVDAGTATNCKAVDEATRSSCVDESYCVAERRAVADTWGDADSKMNAAVEAIGLDNRTAHGKEPTVAVAGVDDANVIDQTVGHCCRRRKSDDHLAHALDSAVATKAHCERRCRTRSAATRRGAIATVAVSETNAWTMTPTVMTQRTDRAQCCHRWTESDAMKFQS